MFSVPGRYSGGSTEAYTWTQTQHEIDLRAPLPSAPPERSVRCTFTAKRLDLSFVTAGDAEAPQPVATGELSAVIAASDCLWSIERDEKGGAVAVVNMRKAAPAIWDRLFASDPVDIADAPKLLDGVERKQPQSKAELLAQAKERLGKELDGPSKAKPWALEKLTDETRTLTVDDLPPLPVVTIRGCKGCTIVLPKELPPIIKLQIEQCERCKFTLDTRLLTETLEVWESDDCSVALNVKSSTVQVDKCARLQLQYASIGGFDRVLSCGARSVELTFGDAPSLRTTIDLDAERKARPGTTIDDSTDQFITRRLGGGGGKGGGDAAAGGDASLTTELVIRLCNEFPTTEREVREFERRTRMHEEALDEVVDGMLGSSLGKSLTPAERDQMKEMMREQSAAASEAKVQAEQTEEGRKAARVAFKKGEGNTAFKEGHYQQAAVFYTEALAIDDTEHALYSNRAACFLKLGRYEQAREDALACTRLKPSFAKGHFRLGLAYQAEEKPAEACVAFGKALELEPNNKEAAAGLNMARMQAERKRRQEAGMTTG